MFRIFLSTIVAVALVTISPLQIYTDAASAKEKQYVVKDDDIQDRIEDVQDDVQDELDDVTEEALDDLRDRQEDILDNAEERIRDRD
jgi:gas vesicle protein